MTPTAAASASLSHRHKRLKTEPDGSCHQSALVPSSLPDQSTDASDEESDDSDLSESSEDPSSESSGSDDSGGSDVDMGKQDHEADIVNLRANRGEKPVMKLGGDALGEDIRPFLKDFLPQLKKANEELEAQKQAGTLKTQEIDGQAPEAEDGQYIEMDLGLGVLEEKNPDKASESSESEGDEEEEGKEKDVLGKLMGRDKKDVTIEEVDSGKS